MRERVNRNLVHLGASKKLGVYICVHNSQSVEAKSTNWLIIHHDEFVTPNGAAPASLETAMVWGLKDYMDDISYLDSILKSLSKSEVVIQFKLQL